MGSSSTPKRVQRRGRLSLLLGAVFAAMTVAAVAYSADIQTDAVLSTNLAAPSQVAIGSNGFVIKVWATGNINNANATGQAKVVTKYFMATNGSITPSANAADQTTLQFTTGVNYSQSPPCGATLATSIQGCPNNPFVVNASLVVASGTADNTTGTLTVATTGSAGLTADNTPDTGIVQVDAPVTNSPPTVSVTGVTQGGTYEIGSVPVAGCSVLDAEDGNSTAAASLGPISGANSAYGLGSQTASCSYTDGGGITRSASATYSIVDTGSPTIMLFSRTPSANSFGWNNSSVTLVWNCSDSGSGTVAATITKTVSTEGQNQSESAHCTDHAGNTSATNTVTEISIDTTAPTAPTVALSPAANALGWNNVAVTATFVWSGDAGAAAAQSGEGSCTTPTVVSDESSTGAGTAISGTCTDKAGNTSDSTTVAVKLDLTKPTITADSGTYLSGSWTNQTVTVTFNCFDALSGLLGTCPATVVVSSNTALAGQNVSASVSDNAGNTQESNTINVKVDKTKPTISGSASPIVPDGSNGWYKTAPTVTFNCGDALSGIATCVVDGSSPASSSVTLSESDTAQAVSGTATDNAGNSEIDSVTGLKIDLSNPAFPTWGSGGISDGGSYYFGFVPAAPPCTSSDVISGLRDCLVSGRLTTVGTHTLTATATDNAGRTSTATRTYTVLAWTLKGFYQPVDMNGVWNTVKNGSTVPLKFNIFAGTTELTDTASVKSLTASPVTCGDASAPADEIEALATGGTTLRYDTTGGQFIYNWQTPKLVGKCYSLSVTTQDGSKLTALFKLK